MYALTAITAVLAVGLGTQYVSQTDFDVPGAPVTSTTVSSMQETIDGLSIDAKFPAALPQNLIFEKSEVTSDGKSADIHYSNGELDAVYHLESMKRNPLTHIDIALNPVTITVEENGVLVSEKTVEQGIRDYSKIKVGQTEAVIVPSDDNEDAKIAWYENGVLYTFSADLSDQEFTNILKSVQ